jgi:hypothetical protein
MFLGHWGRWIAFFGQNSVYGDELLDPMVTESLEVPGLLTDCGGSFARVSLI